MTKLIGTDPNQVPSNADLGTLAYQNDDNVSLGLTTIATEGDSTRQGGGTLLRLKRIGNGTWATLAIEAQTYRGNSRIAFVDSDHPNDTQTTGTANGGGAAPFIFDYEHENEKFQMISNANSRFTVDSTGNVGIGTDTPDYKLDIEGSGNGLIVARVKNVTPGTTARADMLVESDASDIRMIATSSLYTGVAGWADSGVLATSSGTSGGMLFNVQGNYPYRFMQNATAERMRIHTDGSIGIGELTPEAKLHVKNDISADGDTYNNPLMILQNARLNTGTGASTLRFDTNEISAGVQYKRAAISAEYDGTNNLNGRLLFGTADTANVINTHLSIEGDGQVILPTMGMSARYTTSPANYYAGAASYWIRVYYREYQTPNAFGFNAVELKCIAAGRTDGRGAFARILINHKQQQASDQYSLAVLENTNFQIASKFTSNGGSTSNGILEVWVKPNAVYQSVTVQGLARGPTNQSVSSSAGNIVAETTNSSTQPSGSVLLRSQNDVGHLMYRANGSNPALDYQGDGGSRIYFDSGTGVGGSSNSDQNNEQMFHAAYESYGMDHGPIHGNGNWYAGIGTSSWNGDKWVKYAVNINGNDRLVTTVRFTNFSDSTNRTGSIYYSLNGGDDWSLGNSVVYGSSSGSETSFTLNATGWNDRGLHTVLFRFQVKTSQFG